MSSNRKNVEPGLPVSDIDINTNHIKFSYETTNVDAKHFVMWSGGTDSTLLLYELIMAYGAENVFAISYDYPWLLENKKLSEKSHRDLFKSKLECMKYMNGNKINHTEIKISHSTITGKHLYASPGGLPQAVGWLLSIPIYIPNDSYIYLGSIKDDDLTLHMGDYHKMFESMSNVLFRNIILREPYLYFDKYQILDKLFQYGLYDTTWACEMPQEINIPCGKCQPCIHHILSLQYLTNNGSSDYVKIQSKHALDEINSLISKYKTNDCNRDYTKLEKGNSENITPL